MIDQTLNDRYHVTALIGEGAMGEVYRATDTQTGQEVAIKVITQKLAFDDEMLARFRREGEALRQLRHSNIVAFVDMFAVGKQQAIVMEYVPGGSLHNLVKQGPLPIDQAVRITLELSDALSRAHLLNVIHRDIKPENVLMAADGTPRLTDFGVARLIGDTARLTSTGTQLGTPYYMSPEAWEGKKLDEQADIWSLGIVLFEMLAGQLPFTGDTLVAVMNRILTTAPPDLRSLRPDVPPALVKIIQHMLTRDKAKRYGSMREVALDLERVRKDLASRAAPPSAQPKKEAARPAAPKLATPPPESKPATKPSTPKPAPASPAAKPAAPPSAPRPAPVPAAPPSAPAEASTALAPAAETPTIVAPAAETPTLLASRSAASEAPGPGTVDEAATILPPTGEVATLFAAPARPEPAEERPRRRVSPLVIGAGVVALLVIGIIVVAGAAGLWMANNNAASRTTQTALAAILRTTQAAPAVAVAPTQSPQPGGTPVAATNPAPTVAATAVPTVAAAVPTAVAVGGKWCSGVHIVFFPGGPEGDKFAINVYNGARQAAADLGPKVDYVWSDWDPNKMLQQFSESAATRPDGLAVMGHPGDQAFDPLIDEAERNGVIVTSQNTALDLAEAKYAAKGFGYAGAEPYQAGHDLGTEAIKRFNLHKGDRAMVWGSVSSLRTQGAKDALAQAGLTVDYLEIDAATAKDPASGGPAFSAYVASHPDVKLVITDHGGLTATAQTYLTAAGKKPGDIKVAGFDLSLATIPAIKEGWTSLVLDQQGWLQGYLPVLQICLTKVYGFSGLHINTGTSLVDKSNVDTVAPFDTAAAAAAGGKWCSGVQSVFFAGGTQGDVFAVNVYNGAVQAAADLGPKVDYVWSDWDPQKMLQQFTESAATKPDGIAVMGHPGDQAFDPLIDDAESKGIIVTSQNTMLDTAEAKYAAKGFGYVGAELYAAGQSLGNEAVKRFNLQKGDRALVWGLLSQPTRGLRTKGVQDALTKAGLTVDYLEIDSATNADPVQGARPFSAYVASHPDVKLVVIDHGGVTASAQTYLTAAGKKPGDIKIAGFDLSPATIAAIKGGWTGLVIDQQEWLQGYLPILQMCLTKVHGFSGLHINTGAGFVDASNVDTVARLADQNIR